MATKLPYALSTISKIIRGSVAAAARRKV